MASPSAPEPPSASSIVILREPNQRITTDSALQAFVTLFFTRLPCLEGTNHLPKVIAGVRFQAGIEVIQVPANNAA
jgi:hypothetical protein